MNNRFFMKVPEPFIAEGDISIKEIAGFIREHMIDKGYYERLQNLYLGYHDILFQPDKEIYKPDNRIVVNFAKYIVDTFNGFFIGIPIKTTHDDEQVSKYIEFVEKYNSIDDNNSELSKLCSIYGHAYELIYYDENGKICITHLSPQEAFVVYDNSIQPKVKYGVRYYRTKDGHIEGTYSDNQHIYYFREVEREFVITDTKINVFGEVPLIEYLENAERQGAFTGVIPLINAYNKAISEKANDVDYYADAYLLITGVNLDDEEIIRIRDSRVINIPGFSNNQIDVKFLGKPESDAAQENLINRLSDDIYRQSMVCNINDNKFGNASGVGLKYKLQPMMNLANCKERKFVESFNKRWKIILTAPTSICSKDSWVGIDYKFTRNIPSNILEEATVCNQLNGIVSKQTQLKELSLVDNVKLELERIEEEKKKYLDLYE